MATDRFPYDMPSFDALVKLVQDTKPTWRVETGFVGFGDIFHSPTPDVPGRTYIEMENKLTQKKSWFKYRRLDLAIVLGSTPTITVLEAATPRVIAEEINRSRGMLLTDADVDFSDEVLGGKLSTFTYTLKAKPGSFVYYGQTTVTVNIATVSPYARYLEDGSVRLDESGEVRELEY
jgi:hypothetical protein